MMFHIKMRYWQLFDPVSKAVMCRTCSFTVHQVQERQLLYWLSVRSFMVLNSGGMIILLESHRFVLSFFTSVGCWVSSLRLGFSILEFGIKVFSCYDSVWNETRDDTNAFYSIWHVCYEWVLQWWNSYTPYLWHKQLTLFSACIISSLVTYMV